MSTPPSTSVIVRTSLLDAMSDSASHAAGLWHGMFKGLTLGQMADALDDMRGSVELVSEYVSTFTGELCQGDMTSVVSAMADALTSVETAAQSIAAAYGGDMSNSLAGIKEAADRISVDVSAASEYLTSATGSDVGVSSSSVADACLSLSRSISSAARIVGAISGSDVGSDIGSVVSALSDLESAVYAMLSSVALRTGADVQSVADVVPAIDSIVATPTAGSDFTVDIGGRTVVRSPRDISVASADYVDERAFDGNTLLRSFSSPGVTSVMANAFRGCTALSSVAIPEVEYIGPGAFSGCLSLGVVNARKCAELGDSAFSVSGILRADFPLIPNVPDSAFSQCRAMTGVDIPLAASVGDSSFEDCSDLTSVDLPACSSIGSNAFARCSSLESVYMPNATTVGNMAFYGCSSLRDIEAPAVTSVGSSVFTDCISVTNVSLGVDRIADGMFKGCESLSSVSLPAATYVGDSAFLNCYRLSGVLSFPLVVTVGPHAFEGIGGASRQGDISIGSDDASSASSIGNSAFNSATAGSIRINDASSIGEYAFSLASVGVVDIRHSGDLHIGDNAFREASIVAARSSQGEYGQTDDELIVPDPPKYIVIYGSGVTTVGSGAFYGVSMERYTHIFIAASSLGDNAFAYVSGFCPSPDDSTCVHDQYEYYTRYFNTIEISGLTSIGSSVFDSASCVSIEWDYSGPIPENTFTGSTYRVDILSTDIAAKAFSYGDEVVVTLSGVTDVSGLADGIFYKCSGTVILPLVSASTYDEACAIVDHLGLVSGFIKLGERDFIPVADSTIHSGSWR